MEELRENLAHSPFSQGPAVHVPAVSLRPSLLGIHLPPTTTSKPTKDSPEAHIVIIEDDEEGYEAEGSAAEARADGSAAPVPPTRSTTTSDEPTETVVKRTKKRNRRRRKRKRAATSEEHTSPNVSISDWAEGPGQQEGMNRGFPLFSTCFLVYLFAAMFLLYIFVRIHVHLF